MVTMYVEFRICVESFNPGQNAFRRALTGDSGLRTNQKAESNNKRVALQHG